MNKRFFCILFFLLFLYSCHERNCEQFFVITALFNNVNKDIYLNAVDTSINHKILDSIKSERNKSGFITLHKNNKAINRTMYNNNQFTGSIFYYWSDGSLNAYNLRDFQENIRYTRVYKSDSVYISDGKILGQFMWDEQNRDSIPSNDSIVVHLAYAIPPHCSFHILVQDSLDGCRIEKCNDFISIAGISGIATIKNKHISRGHYTRKVFAQLKDSLSHLTEYDTAIVQFIIR